MMPPVLEGAGVEVWVLRFALLLALGMLAFLLSDAWGAMKSFKREFYSTRLNHSNRLTKIETVLELEGDDGG